MPSSPVLTDDNLLCTAKYHRVDIVSLGIEFGAYIFGEMVEFKNNT